MRWNTGKEESWLAVQVIGYRIADPTWCRFFASVFCVSDEGKYYDNLDHAHEIERGRILIQGYRSPAKRIRAGSLCGDALSRRVQKPVPVDRGHLRQPRRQRLLILKGDGEPQRKFQPNDYEASRFASCR